jgi:mycothiol synthase
VTLPAGCIERPAVADDLDAVEALLVTCDLADVGLSDPVRRELKEVWRASRVDLDRDTKVVFSDDGSLAAYALATTIDPTVSVDAYGRVSPDQRDRGIGAHLVSWTEARAREHAGGAGTPTRLWNGIPSTDPAARTLLLSRGYEQIRTFWTMERALAGPGRPVEAISPPPGIRFRTFEPGRDERNVFDVWEEAFAEHFGFASESFDEWRHDVFGGVGVDPELLLVAEDGAEAVAAQLSLVLGDVGWVQDIAVRAPWRGRGIAHALLLRGFADLARRGCRSVRLDVDAENRTGATRLYERVGMTVRREWPLYEKRIGPG